VTSVRNEQERGNSWELKKCKDSDKYAPSSSNIGVCEHLLASAVHPIITQAKILRRKLTASFILVLSKNALEVAESASEFVRFGIFI
jgi:hypothetical protein